MLSSSIDEVRTAHPQLGIVVYALTVGGPVILEIHEPNGKLRTYKGETYEELVRTAFPTYLEAETSKDEEADVFG